MINVKAIRQKIIDGLTERLAVEGQSIINQAASNKTTLNRKMNEHDAYVYGVFYDGVLQKYGYVGSKLATEKAHGWVKNNIEPDYGRNWATKAIKSFTPATIKGYELVVLSTTFYSEINEDRGYKVISQLMGEMQSLTDKFKGGKIRVINTRTDQL